MKKLAFLMLLFGLAFPVFAQRGGSSVNQRAIIPTCTATTGNCPGNNYACVTDADVLYRCVSPATWSVIAHKVSFGATLPSTCEDGEVFIDTSATTGQQFYACESGTYIQQGGGSSAHSNGGNCAAGEIPLGVDGDGVAEGCYEPAAADIASGTFADARVAASNVTQHEAALTITESQISDLVHTGVSTDGVGTGELDDDANTPIAGYLVTVETGALSFDYLAQSALSITESQISDLAHTATAVGAGVVDDPDMATDDFGEWSCAGSVEDCTIDAGVIDDANMATDDFGDFSCAGSVEDCTLDAGVVDTTAILDDTVAAADLADADYGDFTAVSDVFTLDTGVVDTTAILDATLKYEDMQDITTCVQNSIFSAKATGGFNCIEPGSFFVSYKLNLEDAIDLQNLTDNIVQGQVPAGLYVDIAKSLDYDADSTNEIWCDASGCYIDWDNKTNPGADFTFNGSGLGLPGSSLPAHSFDDQDGTSTETKDAMISVNCTDAVDLQEDCDIIFEQQINSVDTEVGRFNADGTFEVNTGITITGTTNLSADAVNALTEVAQGIKTAANDTDPLAVYTGGNPGSNVCVEMNSSGQLIAAANTCANLGPGGTTTIDALGDAGGVGAVQVGTNQEYGQTWTWNTPATTVGALDGLKLIMDLDATTDAQTQSLLALERSDGAGTTAMESILNINNAEVSAAVTSGIEIRSAAGGMTAAIDANDAQITNIITHAGGSVTSSDLDIIDDGQIDDTDMANEDFGDFTCSGSEDGCVLTAGAVSALTDLSATLCGTSEILEDQGGSWACITTPTGGSGDDVTVDSGFTNVVDPQFTDTATVAFTGTDAAPDTVTADFLPAGVGTATWLDNADRTWTFDIAAAGTNPTISFASDSIAFANAATFTVDGNAILDATSTSAALTASTGNTLTLGSGTFTALTVDAGATDPVLTFGSNSLAITNAATFTVGGSAVVLGTTPTLTGTNFTGIPAGAFSAAAIDGDDINSNIAGLGLTLTAGSPDQLDVAKHTECFSLYDADTLAAVNIMSVWQAPAAVTVTAISCEADVATDTTINLNKDDSCNTAAASTTNMETGDLQCGTTMTAGVVTTAGGEDNLADGDCVDLEIVSTTLADSLTICMEYTID